MMVKSIISSFLLLLSICLVRVESLVNLTMLTRGR